MDQLKVVKHAERRGDVLANGFGDQSRVIVTRALDVVVEREVRPFPDCEQRTRRRKVPGRRLRLCHVE